MLVKEARIRRITRDILTAGVSLFCLLTLAGQAEVKAQDYPPRPWVLVAPFRVNADANAEKIGATVMETVSGELRKSLLLVLKSDKKLSFPVSDEGLIKLAHDKAAAFVVYGSVTALRGSFSLDFRLMNAIEEKRSPPLFAVARGDEVLVAQSGKLARAIGQRILEGWGRLPKEKLVAYYKSRPVTPPAPALAQKEKPPVQVKQPAPAKKKPALGSRVKVGVVPFQINVLRASADLPARLWKTLIRELELGEQVAVVGQDTARQFIAGSRKFDQSEEGIKKLAAEIGADYLVYGSYTKLGQHMSLDFRIFHNLLGAPFAVQKVFVEGRGTRASKIKQLAFQLKRRFLKGKIIITPLAGPEPPPAKRTALAEEKKAGGEVPASRQEKAAPLARPLSEERVIPAEPKKAETKERAAKLAEKPARRKTRATGLGSGFKRGSGPIKISARTLEADNRRGTVTFKGNVVARRGDMVISSDILIASYSNKGKEIEKIVAQGNVKVTQGDTVAVGQKVVFFNAEQKVVLSQGAKIWQGRNEVSGETITVFLGEDRMVVEGSGSQRVNAIIFSSK